MIDVQKEQYVQLTMIGGGGFRTPLVHQALLSDDRRPRVDQVVLYDTDPARLAAMAGLLAQQREASGGTGPQVRTSTDLVDAVRGTDFVFSAIRVGGLPGRVVDEQVPLQFGLLGQETVGPGGVAYGLRTVPEALRIATAVAEHAPRAWVINFTNPAGMITEAMSSVLGDRVIGICDSPLGLATRACRALGVPLDVRRLDYAGLNHLGWLSAVRDESGTNLLPALLDDPHRLESFEEGRLFGADWLRILGLLPNEYLYYYDFTREAIAGILAADRTRGEFLVAQQREFYAAIDRRPATAFARWRQVRADRDAAYMAEARAEGEQRDAEDVAGGGYEGVALALMSALSRDEPTALILNVRNGSGGRHSLPSLDAEAVVEVPCEVDATGPRPLPTSPLPAPASGLVQQIKGVDRLVIAAATQASSDLAVEALALHPLVDSVDVARRMFDQLRERIPSLAAVFAS